MEGSRTASLLALLVSVVAAFPNSAAVSLPGLTDSGVSATVNDVLFAVDAWLAQAFGVTRFQLTPEIGIPLWAACVGSLALLFFMFGLGLPRGAGDGAIFAGASQTPERLTVFAKWAQQQIAEAQPEAHRQILDDVIHTFATYAQRLEQDPSPVVRRAAVTRLQVLVDLLEVPSVNAALRDVNWAWLKEWDRKALEPLDARLRFTTVFPTICAAYKVKTMHPRGGALAALFCSRRASGVHLDSQHSLAYLAAWCADFLERPDVRAALGFVTERQLSTGSGVNFLLPGALFSDSEEEDEEETPYVRGGVTPGPADFGSEEADKGQYRHFSRLEYEGQDHCWSEPDATQALVRGPNYLVDHKKFASRPAMLQLVEVDLIKTYDEMIHYSVSDRGQVPRLREQGDDRFFFVLNFRLTPIQLAVIWAVPKNSEWETLPEGRLFRHYVEMTDENSNPRLKVLPKVVEGPWLVKKGVPERPGIVGRKLRVDYYQNENHLEASINCISSTAGRRIVNLLTGASKLFSMELYIILESRANEELPERVLGGVAVHHGDLSALRPR